MTSLLLAIDGGGTKTKACLIDKNNHIVYQALSKVGSFAVNKKEAIKNIDFLIEACLKFTEGKYKIYMIQMGISGLGAIFDVLKIEKRYFKKYKIKVSIENDAYLALYSVLKDKYSEGLVILSGTGSALCAAKDNKSLLFGGWGHLLDEFGSAYSLVRSAILFVKEEFEQTGLISSFGKKLLEVLKLKNVYEFKAFMYTKTKYEVASYSKWIASRALEKDEVATHLLEKCADDLKASIKRLKNRLNLSPNAILGFRGGFICDAPIVKEKLKNDLASEGINFIYEDEDKDPIYGAYYMRKEEFLKC